MKYFTKDTMLKALDVVEINFFCSKDFLKNKYRCLCSTHHPDKGGKTEIMQNINWAYKYINKHFESLKLCFEIKQEISKKFDLSEESKKIFEQLILLDEIEVYIVGCWLWVEGNTKPHKETLKALGLYWHSKKGMWAYAGSKTKSKGNLEFDKICNVYGSSKHYKQTNLKIS